MARRGSRAGAGTPHRSLAVFQVRSQRFGQIVRTSVLQSHSRPCPAQSRCFSLRDARKRCEGCPENVCEKITHVNQSFGARRAGVKAKTPSRCDTLRLSSQWQQFVPSSVALSKFLRLTTFSVTSFWLRVRYKSVQVTQILGDYMYII